MELEENLLHQGQKVRVALRIEFTSAIRERALIRGDSIKFHAFYQNNSISREHSQFLRQIERDLEQTREMKCM